MNHRSLQYIMGILFLGFCFVSYIDKQNKLAYLRMQIPKAKEELQALGEEIAALHYDIDQFESPGNLMDIAQAPEFRHLQHPTMNDILSISEGYAVKWEPSTH